MRSPETPKIGRKLASQTSDLASTVFRLRRNGGRGAFSLVEVAIALGIFAFAIVPIVGLMGAGLKISKDSIDSSTTTQIFRKALALIETNSSVTEVYFSKEGKVMGSVGAVYKANLTATNLSDAAQGLLARRVWRVSVVKADAQSVTNAVRTIQISRDLETSDFQ